MVRGSRVNGFKGVADIGANPAGVIGSAIIGLENAGGANGRPVGGSNRALRGQEAGLHGRAACYAPGMQRYAVITGKLPREIVLLKGLPCVWSKCTFCDYIADNTADADWIERVADEELAKVTGRFGRLEVINSGSIQELTDPVRRQIRDLLGRLGIGDFICESYWAYRKQWDATRAFFGVPTRIKLGVETFDAGIRNGVLNKAMVFDGPEDVARLTDTICLLVGVRGQTRDMVRRDIDILLTHFTYGCVNLFSANSRSSALMDDELKAWFAEEYAELEQHPHIEVLWENTAFGVGELPILNGG